MYKREKSRVWNTTKQETTCTQQEKVYMLAPMVLHSNAELYTRHQ